MPALKAPTFFLIGFPRCGTTAMSKFLAWHPQVCFSRPKETHFFTEVAAGGPVPDLAAAYLEPYFFHHDPARHRAVGEGSVSYAYSPEALRLAQQVAPSARFLVMVRNPVEMVHSYHGRMLYVLEEDEEDLRRAWELQAARERGESLPRSCRQPAMLRYRDVGSLGTHLGRVFDTVGRESCHVVVHDDLVSDPRRSYLEVLDFLGVDDDGRTEFPERMQTKGYRHRWLHRLLYKPPSAAGKLVSERHLRGGRRAWWKELRKALIKRNRVETGPRPFPPATRELLREAFAAEVDALESLLDRDLSAWR